MDSNIDPISATEQQLMALKPMLNTLPQVVISGCLMGEKVRYDGGHKRQQHLHERLEEFVTLRSFCPEVAAGMGIPREPIHWIETRQDKLELQQVTAPHTSYEIPVRDACEDWLATYAVDAAILKARSPSCGVGTTPVVSTRGQLLPTIDGLWVQCIKRHVSSALIVDESFIAQRADTLWFVTLLYLRQIEQQASAPIQWAQQALTLDTPEQQRQAIYSLLPSILLKD